MTLILQQSINGLVLGNLYVLVALGLTLIYGVLVQINFAHADIVTLGAFSAYFFVQGFGGGYLPAIAVALTVGGIAGWLINAAIFAPLRNKRNELLPLIATIGVSVTMENVMLAGFGPIPYAFNSPYSNDVIRFGGTFITVQNALIVAVSVFTIASLYAFMKFTFLGKALRAVAQDRRNRRADGDQSRPAGDAHFRDRIGAGRHGGRAARPGAGADALRRHLSDR